MTDTNVHATAQCESSDIGSGVSVGAFAYVESGARVGTAVAIGSHVRVESGAVIGDRVKIGAGAHIAAHVVIEDDAIVGDQVVFAPERADSHGAPGGIPVTVVRSAAELGSGTTILRGVEVGRGAVVGPGSVVARSVPPYALASGNPSRVINYIGADATDSPSRSGTGVAGVTQLEVRGVSVHRFTEFTDPRGSLVAGEMPAELLPFVPRRWFLVYDVPSRELRGEHAHRECHQFLLCVAGSLTVAVDDGRRRAEIVLDRPDTGVYIPPMVWGSQFRYEPDSVLLVFASHPYDAGDYIREYEGYLAELGNSELSQ